MKPIKVILSVLTIAATIVAAIIGVQSKKDERPSKIEQTQNQQDNSRIAISKDSSTQKIIYLDQKNSNNGDVKTEIIQGDKNEYYAQLKSNREADKQPIYKQSTGTIPKQSATPGSPNTHIDKIENNGNLSIGQTGGVVNQTIVVSKPKPSPRSLNNEDKAKILNSIPKEYPIEFNHPFTDEESVNFANQMLNFLKASGYTIESLSVYGIIFPDLEESFTIVRKDAEKKAAIAVYKLK